MNTFITFELIDPLTEKVLSQNSIPSFLFIRVRQRDVCVCVFCYPLRNRISLFATGVCVGVCRANDDTHRKDFCLGGAR